MVGLQPLGVIAGMVNAMVTRASFSARLSWFQSLDWLRVSRMLRGPAPMAPADKSAGEPVAGLEKAVNPESFVEPSGEMPVQLHV